jgi:outer membrane lipoprotein-sorting protein
MTLGRLARRTTIGLVLACLVGAPSVWTAGVWTPDLARADPAARPPAPLSADDRALVDRSAAYLQGLDAMKGRFEQIDARGEVTRGDLYLKRPGRARFAYDPPSGVQVISDGYTVMVTDPRLKTVNRYALALTPLSLLLAKQVRLDKGVAVSAVDRLPDGYALTAHDARHPAQGQITLIFSESPLQLREWRISDAQGRTTRFRLLSFAPADGLDPSLFVVPPPHGAR